MWARSSELAAEADWSTGGWEGNRRNRGCERFRCPVPRIVLRMQVVRKDRLRDNLVVALAACRVSRLMGWQVAWSQNHNRTTGQTRPDILTRDGAPTTSRRPVLVAIPAIVS